MAAAAADISAPTPKRAPTPVRPARERTSSWPLADRVAYGLCWAVGVGLCLVTAWIVLFMLVKGLSYVSAYSLTHSPEPSLLQKQSGGFMDPILGTLLITAIGIVLAAPAGIALAVWLTEYGRPAWLARAVESLLEVLAGVPSVVLAIFGLLIFSRSFLGFLSQHTAEGHVTGTSFLTAGIVMAVLALPLVVASTREGLMQLPDRLREASYALGKTRATTIRRVLLPSVRPGMGTGTVLGMGRIIGDTAIITILLGGAAQKLESAGGTPILDTLKGFGSTLTSYVYYQSPAGEGNSHEKAYAAAFVLLIMVLLLNALATSIANRAGAATTGRGRAGRRGGASVRGFGSRLLDRLGGTAWTN